jgi:hypothetical protein
MTVYLHCEGVTDYAVIPALMKEVSKKPDLEIQWIKRETLKGMKTHRKSGVMISGHYKMIKALATFSFKENCKCIAYHQDADGKYTDVYKKLDSEFNHLREKFRCLAIVPKETIESWLLADENAYPEIPKNPALPEKPEELWGDSRDPNSNHPKRYLSRVLKQFHLENNRDTYAQIAENSDVEIIKRRCCNSFGQFCDDMQGFITDGVAL